MNDTIENSKVENNMEVEYKFFAGNTSKEDFHAIIENTLGKTFEPLYVVSCDDYYIRKENDECFLRYRKGGDRHELTLKLKRFNNVIRKEINLNMNENDDSAIVDFLKLSGYFKAFSVFKEAWIWRFEFCDVSYYTLSDGRSYIEVEATKYDHVSDGLKIINFWANKLSLNDLEREKRSLFEIFTDDVNLVNIQAEELSKLLKNKIN